MAFRVSCGKCGEAYYHGDAHKCLPRPKLAKAVKSAKPIPHATPNKIEATPNAKGKPTPNKPQGAKAGRKARDKRYRKAHKAQRSAYMRVYMRSWRALQRAAAVGIEGMRH
jgi:hypothetical protein